MQTWTYWTLWTMELMGLLDLVNLLKVRYAGWTAVTLPLQDPIPSLILFCSMAVLAQVLYMSFDRFLLAVDSTAKSVESRDLSQADKSIICVSSFPKLSDG